ncbi:MAG: endonuclease/exonuclease/phosphatase family protein, partial [Akkermansiaceae bacterium]
MLHTFRSNHFQSAALIIIAAFFSLAACKNKAATPEWEQSQAEGTEQDAATITAQAADDKQAENGNTNKEPATAEKSNKPVRFLAYNLKNYLTMGRYINGKRVQASKPEEEIAPLIKLIVEAKPDVLGVCEIGSDADLADLQKRLKTAGIDLPHTHRAHGSDSVRALAILSRYPITATAKPAETGYKLGDIDFHISRGVLDATIKLPNREVRFLGCHLKSKRPIKEADQELMRRNESSILRKHINTILE